MHFKHLSLAVFTAFFSILGLSAFADSDPAPGYTRLTCLEASSANANHPFINTGVKQRLNSYTEIDMELTKAPTSSTGAYIMSSFYLSLYADVGFRNGKVCGRVGKGAETDSTVDAPAVNTRFTLKCAWRASSQRVTIGD